MLGFAAIGVVACGAAAANGAIAPLQGMSLRAADVPGSRVVAERRTQDPGQIVGFERDFAGGRIGSTSLARWQSAVTLTSAGSVAAELQSTLSRIATASNPAVIEHLFRSISDAGPSSRIVSIRVERNRVLAGRDPGTELGLVVRVAGTQYASAPLDFRFTVAFVRVDRVVGTLLLLAPPGSQLRVDDVSALERAFVNRIRAGLTS
jgi:hypothetical protein